jgi:methyl-accepting chemotaxis protein
MLAMSVKQGPPCPGAFAASTRAGSDFGIFPETAVTAAVFVLAAVMAISCFVLLQRRARRMSPHQRAVRDVLDAADALEDRLRVARDEIEAVAGDAAENAVAEALREMLRQRLWLRDHGAGATPQQLADVRQAIDDARTRIDDQLARIEQARAPRV